MSYQRIPPPQLPRGIVPMSEQPGMGITVSVTGNEAVDRALYWGFLATLGIIALNVGYYAFTGHKLMPSTRTPAAWEVFG